MGISWNWNYSIPCCLFGRVFCYSIFHLSPVFTHINISVGRRTSGQNLGTLIVTNGFLRTVHTSSFPYLLLRLPRRSRCQTKPQIIHHPSLHRDHGSRRITQRLYDSSSATRPNAPKLAHDEVDTPNYIILQFHSHRSIFRP